MDYKSILLAKKTEYIPRNHFDTLFAKRIGGAVLKDFPGLPASIVTVTDALAKPLERLKVAITPVQSGSGDPSPDNIRPISGWDEANIVVRNNEFFDKTEFVAGPPHKVKLDNGNVSNQDGFSYTANFIEISGGISVGVIGTITPSQKASRLYFYDAKKNWIGRSDAFKAPATINIPDNAKYIQFQYYMSVIDTDTIHIKPSGAETVDYQGTTYPITFPSEAGTVYGGTLDVVNGTLTVTDASINLEDNASKIFFNKGYNCWVLPVNPLALFIGKYNVPDILTSVGYIPREFYYNLKGDNTIGVTDYGYLFVGNNSDAVKPTGQVVYPIATPKTYQLTPTEVQMLLGTNNLWADTGDILEGKYYGKRSSSTRAMLNTLQGAREITRITPEEPEEVEEPEENADER